MKEIVKLFVPVSVRNFLRWNYRRAKARIEIALWTLLGRPLYSIVIPCHNVDKYIDDLLQSIFDQIGKSRQFEIIAVDDGSSDRTLQVIKKWEVKFQGVLRVIQFERNMGVSAARNRGMQKSRGLWVTFPDGDDILGEGYILKSVKTIRELDYLNLLIVQCELHFYREEWMLTEDTHPLRSKFNTPKPIKVKNLGNRFMMHVTTCWIKKKYVTQSKLFFNEKLKVSEDATFIGELCLLYPEAHVKFIKGAVYLYRKRQDKTSTLDTSTRNVSWLIDPLEQFMIFLLEHPAVGSQRPPTWLQHKILYDLSWKIRALIEDPSFSSSLSGNQEDQVFKLLQTVFDSIDESLIMSHRVGMRRHEKLGLLSMFKHSALLDPPVYFIKSLDGGTVVQHYEGADESSTTAALTRGLGRVVHQKVRTIRLLGRDFLKSKITFIEHPYFGSIEYRSSSDKVIPVYFTNGSLLTKDIFRVSDLDAAKASFNRVLSGHDSPKSTLDLLVMDRVDRAGDNGEALYRHVSIHHTKIRIAFVLSRNCPDWNRLSEQGFRLIEYQSREHYTALASSQIFASSSIDDHVLNPPGFKPRQGFNFKFVFLQHGVIMHNLSKWLNSKSVSLFLTSTEKEHLSITSPESPYAFMPSQVVRTGLPRWDYLRSLSRDESRRSFVTIAPTWRKYLVKTKEWRSVSSDNAEHSEFSLKWSDVIHRVSNLREIVDGGLKVIVLPHPGVNQKMLGKIDHNFVQFLGADNAINYAEILSKTKVLITDYSSIAFDAAAAGTGVLYFQFDRKEMYSGGHVSQEGYFDFNQDGFGPVSESPLSLTENLKKALNRRSQDEFTRRAEKTFDMFDGNASERVTQEIIKLLAY